RKARTRAPASVCALQLLSRSSACIFCSSCPNLFEGLSRPAGIERLTLYHGPLWVCVVESHSVALLVCFGSNASTAGARLRTAQSSSARLPSGGGGLFSAVGHLR